MKFPKLARRGWLLPAEVVLLGVGIAAALLSLSAARIGLSTALRVPNPSRTFFVGRGHGPIPQANYPDIAFWQERKVFFSRVGAFSRDRLLAGPVFKPVNIDVAWVTPGMIPFLPQRMAAGRLLTDSDFVPGSNNVLVSDALVKRLGLQSPGGSLVETSVAGYRIAGVLPPWSRFPYPSQPDLIIPTVPNPQDTADDYTVLGELRPGLTREQAERGLNSAPGGGREATQPVRLVSMKAALDPASVRISEYGLGLGLLTLLMLIATATLIELLDAIRGKRERAIKLALGAMQGRLVLERTLEVLVICILGTAAGGLLVVLGQPWFARAWATDWVTVPRLDGFTLAALGALLFFCCLAVSIAPALVARATRAHAALKEERASTSRVVQRSRMAIIALQVAVSIAFGFGAAKLAGGLHALATEPLGINAANVWDGSLNLSVLLSSGPMPSRIDAQHRAAFEKQWQTFMQRMPVLRDRLRVNLRALPGVADVGFSDVGLATGPFEGFEVRVVARGENPSPGSPPPFIPMVDADSHYLQLLGCRLLAGRYFTSAEALAPPGKLPGGGPISSAYAQGATPVILSEPLAQRLFGNANPIGKQIDYLMPTLAGEPSDDFATVVGVVAGIKWFGLTIPAPEQIFRPSVVVPAHFTLRMQGSAGISLAEVQHAVSEVSPGTRVENFDLLRHRFESELVVPGQRLGLLAFFAMISAAVAALGLASVLLVVIKERDLEIGIRRALGASDRDLAAALLRRVLPWVGLGLAVGLVFPILFPVPMGIGVATGRADALWAGVLAILAMLVLIAASLWIPLRRAFRRPVNDLLRAE